MSLRSIRPNQMYVGFEKLCMQNIKLCEMDI